LSFGPFLVFYILNAKFGFIKLELHFFE